MKKRILILALCLMMLAGCGKPSEKYERQVFAMDTVMSLQVWGRDGDPVLQDLEKNIWDMEARLSVTREGSALWNLNRDGEVTLSEAEAEMLRTVLDINQKSGGVLDPCLYPVTSLWGFTTGQYRVPGENEISRELSRTGAQNVHLDGNTVTLEPGAEMDLGAAVKGWAGQVCADRLAEEKDIVCGLLYLGGNIQTYGTKVDGSDWRIGIQDPFSSATAGVLNVQGTCSVVTSGGYQRFFEEDGLRYCHIIDPATGHPAESGLASVTIVARDGLLADCLSTTLYILGLEKAGDYWRENGGFEAVFITDEGRIYATEGLKDALSGCEFEVIAK